MTYGLIAAAAGAGKTHTVAAYASARTRLTGKRVIGITTAENAARQMTAEGLAEVYEPRPHTPARRVRGWRTTCTAKTPCC